MYLQKKQFWCLFSLLLFVLAQTQNIYANNIASPEETTKLKAFVESGVAYLKKYGPKKAYAEFNKTNGIFRQGEMYIYVYDYKGTCLAHGSTISRVGKNFFNERDKYGTQAVQLVITIAKTGGGFFTFYWPDPSTNQIKLKTAYVVGVDNHIAIGSGLYKFIDVPAEQILVKTEEVKAFINTGIEYFKAHGEQAAYKEFSNPNGAFRMSDMYLFVLNSKGVFLANGFWQKLIGKNAYDYKDDFGTPFIQLLIQVAQDGGGSVSYYGTQPSTGKIRLKVDYIVPLTNDAYIGSGFYGD